MQTEHQRRKLVTWALNVTQGTTLAPGPYERQLLEHYVSGSLSLDEVIALLEAQPSVPVSAGPATTPQLACHPPVEGSAYVR